MHNINTESGTTLVLAGGGRVDANNLKALNNQAVSLAKTEDQSNASSYERESRTSSPQSPMHNAISQHEIPSQIVSTRRGQKPFQNSSRISGMVGRQQNYSQMMPEINMSQLSAL